MMAEQDWGDVPTQWRDEALFYIRAAAEAQERDAGGFEYLANGSTGDGGMRTDEEYRASAEHCRQLGRALQAAVRRLGEG